MASELSDSVLLKSALATLGLLVPVILPAAAFALGARLTFWWRSAIVILASLMSLPLGFVLMLLAEDPALLSRTHINPGIGVAAIPLMLEWAVIFAGIVIVGLYLAVGRAFFRSKR